MEIRMDGRVALITGGSKGLGYAMGLKFAESGAQVALFNLVEVAGVEPASVSSLPSALHA